MRKVYIAVLSLALVLVAALAFARPWGLGDSGTALTAEEQKFFESTRDLRKEMHDKRFELRELYRTENPDQARIETLEKEIDSLRAKIQETAKEMNVYGSGGCGNCQQGCQGRGMMGKMMWR